MASPSTLDDIAPHRRFVGDAFAQIAGTVRSDGDAEGVLAIPPAIAVDPNTDLEVGQTVVVRGVGFGRDGRPDRLFKNAGVEDVRSDQAVLGYVSLVGEEQTRRADVYNTVVGGA